MWDFQLYQPPVMEEPSRGQILNVLKARIHMIYPFWTQRDTSESTEGETDPFSSSHENSSWAARALLDSVKLPASLFILPRWRKRKKKRKERGGEPQQDTSLGLIIILCLTCNQNNSNPVTVCAFTLTPVVGSRPSVWWGLSFWLRRICQSPQLRGNW